MVSHVKNRINPALSIYVDSHLLCMVTSDLLRVGDFCWVRVAVLQRICSHFIPRVSPSSYKETALENTRPDDLRMQDSFRCLPRAIEGCFNLTKAGKC